MKNIENLVCRIIKKYKTYSAFEICSKMAIRVMLMDLPDDVKGFYVKFLKNRVIIINNSIPLKDMECVCAHELGHIFLHENVNSIKIENESKFDVSIFEKEAEYFSRCFLKASN
ncbi:MAG: ImmA/IrrE family metallo-endopeptidase [Oscillospiraceae bacterium]|jgi:Zn-dependent peptidase ImmA (M78 family)|nr:ImmA/IrrE family metallo-endopeptidase [Oscillospiraceae bacterium]